MVGLLLKYVSFFSVQGISLSFKAYIVIWFKFAAFTDKST